MKPCRLKRACPCGSSQGLIEPSGNMHPAKLSCWDCGRFQRWLSKAEAIRARSQGFLVEDASSHS